jgi:DNA-binding response OmpR family regulator
MYDNAHITLIVHRVEIESASLNGWGLGRGTITAPIVHTRVVLIENNQRAAQTVCAALAKTDDGSFEVEWTRQLSEGLTRVCNKGVDAVLLNLTLPDSQGIETLDKLFNAARGIPILILGENVSKGIAKLAVGRGAQDYLLPDHLEYSLARALRNAIERRAVDHACQPPAARLPS